MNPPPASSGAPAADKKAERDPKKRKPTSATQKYVCHFIFLALVIAGIVQLNRIAASGYFERHMDDVRHVAADKYLARQRKLPNASVLPSGLIFSILKRGTGDRAPALDEVCEMHYHGQYRFFETFIDTHENSYPDRKAPADFIPGIAEALQLMREGDTWNLIVPYTLAYGVEGNKEMNMPSFVNLRYKVELLRCPDGPRGLTSEEIDAFLAPHLKTPMPKKEEPTNADL